MADTKVTHTEMVLSSRSLPSNSGQARAGTRKLQTMHWPWVLSPQAIMPSSVYLAQMAGVSYENLFMLYKIKKTYPTKQGRASPAACGRLPEHYTVSEYVITNMFNVKGHCHSSCLVFLGFFHLGSSSECLHFIWWLEAGGVLWQVCLYVPAIWDAEAGGCLGQRHEPYWGSIARL